jgi:hypothetical protein
MLCLVDARNSQPISQNFHVADGSRLRREPLVRRDRLIEQLQKQCPDSAVMPDVDHGVGGRAFENQP